MCRDPLTPATSDTRQFKTSLVFSLPDDSEAGQLFTALSVFALREIDLTLIESRPQRSQPLGTSSKVQGRRFRYLFYVDFAASVNEPAAQNALRHLQVLTGCSHWRAACECALLVRWISSRACRKPDGLSHVTALVRQHDLLIAQGQCCLGLFTHGCPTVSSAGLQAPNTHCMLLGYMPCLPCSSRDIMQATLLYIMTPDHRMLHICSGGHMALPSCPRYVSYHGQSCPAGNSALHAGAGQLPPG